MNTNAPIPPDVIAQYCLGLLSQEDQAAIAQQAAQNATVKQAIDRFMEQLEQHLRREAAPPPAAVKTKTLLLLNNLHVEQHGSLVERPVLNKYSDYKNWLRLLKPLLPQKLDGSMFVQEFRNDKQVSQTLIWTRVDYPDEVHSDVHESIKGDCNDKDPNIHPGAKGRCNGVDDDCDGKIDEDCTGPVWYRDADGDGWGNPTDSTHYPTQQKGWVSNKLDCDDKNKTKGGPEVCDGIDNDCDGLVDEGFTLRTFYSDYDSDGYGSPKRSRRACAAPPRYVAIAGDLNDDNPKVYPGAPELCDGLDNDCNGKIDDGLPQKPFYWDHDKDGYGFFRPVYACAAPPGYIAVGGDFNDNDTSIHPGAVEHCDGVDEDCDGVIDNGFPQKRFYKDRDSDGWGSNSNLMAGCAPKGYVERSGDCNDYNAAVHPGATEIPGNGVDDNCNGQVDEPSGTVTFYGVSAGDLFDGRTGTVFSFNTSNLKYVRWWNFEHGNGNGYGSAGGLVKAKDSKLYGTTLSGGLGGGIIFSFDPNTATYKKVWDFNDEDNSGRYPSGTLTQATDGKLYGMAADGGANGVGVLYSFDPATLQYSKWYDFDGINGKMQLFTAVVELLQAPDGKLYGGTNQGGAYGNEDFQGGYGVLFSFDPVTATYTKLFDFDGTNGAHPTGRLLPAPGGTLYGITEGTLFTFDTAKRQLTTLASFADINAGGANELLQASDGKLYGTTVFGGADNLGTIFSFDPATAKLKKLFEFDTTTGAYPSGGLTEAGGQLYGTTSSDGAKGGGTLFSFDPQKATFKSLLDFPLPTNGGAPIGRLIEYEPDCGQITYYPDKDSDSYGANNGAISIAGCTPPQGYVPVARDCNDTNAAIHPGVPGNDCNGIDNNCNGSCGGAVTKAQKSIAKPFEAPSLRLSVTPNPTRHYFNLRIESKSNKPVQLQMVDAVGRVVEYRHNVPPNSTVPVAHLYRPGLYYAQAIQERRWATVKLVKTSQ